jgi:hypothetical protein
MKYTEDDKPGTPYGVIKRQWAFIMTKKTIKHASADGTDLYSLQSA